MAKLTKTKAKAVDAAESNFTPMDAGAYHVRLVNVDPEREGPSGPYWNWEFDVVEDGYANRKLWTNTSLSDAADWKMRETFAAFDVASTTDTDELIGQVCKAIVSVGTSQGGKTKGQLVNQIDKLVPADDEFELPAELATSSASGEDIF